MMNEYIIIKCNEREILRDILFKYTEKAREI